MKTIRKLTALLVIFATIATMCPIVYADTTTETVSISTADELYSFAERVNNGETSLNAVLTNDITVNEGTMGENTSGAKVWTPIGNSSNNYTGIFDGQGHTISGLYFNDTSAVCAGLFGYIRGAEVKNTNVANSYINGNVYVGGICGYNSGTISGCNNSGLVKETFSGSGNYNGAGGICGYNNSGTISDCSNSGTVKGTVSGSGSPRTGGICGYNNSGTISGCSNMGMVSGSGNSYVGGICGYNSSSGTISSCCYLSGTAESGIGSGSGEAAEKTAAEYASGEACYLLNGSISGGENWHQTLGTDDYPVLDSTHGKVYTTINKFCPNYSEIEFNNTGDIVEIINPDHTYDYDGKCIYCGEIKVGIPVFNSTLNAYEISDKYELRWFVDYVNNENVEANAVLTADITVNEGTITAESKLVEQLIPMGTQENPYAGNFDGQGHTIRGLYFNDTSAVYAGLFGYIASGAEVKNTNVANSYINGYKYVGGICGYNDGGAISGCINIGTVSGSVSESSIYYVGGICGYNGKGTISSCSNMGTVSGSGNYYVGGICGYNDGAISGCHNSGTVSGVPYVGCICGYNGGGISNCSNSGTISRGSYVGGICGYNGGGISNCSNSGTISGDASYVGGICGYSSSGTISSCYNTGDISGSIDSGGICGYNGGKILNCSNRGTVSGEYDLGGICGYSYGGTISSCSNTGRAWGGNSNGSICGTSYSTISGCYYLEGTALSDIGKNYGDGKTTAKTSEEYASGEVCYLLNGSVSGGETWYQTLGTDSAPMPNNTHGKVYITTNKLCPNYSEKAGYNNKGNIVEAINPDHTYGDDEKCVYCGKALGLPNFNSALNAYEISDKYELRWFVDYVNNENTEANAILTADITVNEGTITADSKSAEQWTPMGTQEKPYTGTFDGQGHTVSGLYFNNTSANYAGLFGYIASGAEVKNINIVNSYINGNSYVGGICGYNGDGTISGCSNSGTISGISDVGGICGCNSGTISRCNNMGTVSGDNGYVGGICGNNGSSGTISNCCYLSSTVKSGIGAGSGEATEKTAEEYASGEVCYLLNGSVSGGDTWYQTIGTDDYPVLDSAHDKVYTIINKFCPNYSEIVGYNNTGDVVEVINPDHTYGDDGKCVYCGEIKVGIPIFNSALNAYEISDKYELRWFVDYVNNENTGANAILTADITVNKDTITAESTSAEQWTPMGTQEKPYAGTFDGQGHTVSGLYFNDTSVDYAGLFGYIASGAEVKNINVINSYINGNSYVGGICGYNDGGAISGCSNSGTFSGGSVSFSSGVGGICGYNCNGGIISGCSNKGAVSGSSHNVGGICGYNRSSTISDCSNSGTFSGGYGSFSVGGICGYNGSNGIILVCSNMGVSIDKGSYVGGICGYNDGTISSCYYLSGTANEGIDQNYGNGEAAEKTAKEYASGEVCYLLNGSVSGGETWYQTIGTDDYPVLDSAHDKVYTTINKFCPNYSEIVGYNNIEDVVEEISPDHTYSYDGKCIYCGEVEAGIPAFNSALNAYEISNKYELRWFADYVNNENAEANAILTADITVNEGTITADSKSAEQWTPMGTQEKPYTGTFDGQEYTVSGLYFNNTSVDYAGLFGYITSGAEVKNINVFNSYINGGSYVGGICGYSGGTISSCSNMGTVSGSRSVSYSGTGGICGYNYGGTISGCSNSGTVNGTISVSVSVSGTGGICGVIGSGTISGCSNSGTVSGGGEGYIDDVGGICGYSSGTISSCSNTGAISGCNRGFDKVGGICGNISGVKVFGCCYLEGTANRGIGFEIGIVEAVEKTAEEYASGEVCYLLNGSVSGGDTWHQTLGIDDYPVLDSTHDKVYINGKNYVNKYVKGDLNGNEILDKTDAAIVLKYCSGVMSEEEFTSKYNLTDADYNEDNTVDIKDVIAVLNAAA